MSVGPSVVQDGLKIQVDFGSKKTFDPVPTSLPIALDSSTNIINTAPDGYGTILGNASPESAFTYYSCFDVAKSISSNNGNLDGDPGTDIYVATNLLHSGKNAGYRNDIPEWSPFLTGSTGTAGYLMLRTSPGNYITGLNYNQVYYLENENALNASQNGFYRWLGTKSYPGDPSGQANDLFKWVASHNNQQRSARLQEGGFNLNTDPFSIYNAEKVSKWGYEGHCIANEHAWSSGAPVNGWVNINHNQNYSVDTDPFTIEVWFRMRDLPTATYGDGTPVYGNRQGSNYAIFVYPQGSPDNSSDYKSHIGVCYDDSRYNNNHRSIAEIGQMEWVQFVHLHTPANGIRGRFEYYVNGQPDTPERDSSDSNGFSVPNTLAIGHDFRYDIQSRIDMAIIRHYDRKLTAAEIKQNFEANRGRFGL